VLQTHKFFGSEKDCYAGVRGIDIALKLEEKLKKLPTVTVLRNSPVVAIFKDKRRGLQRLQLLSPGRVHRLVVASGARRKPYCSPATTCPGFSGPGPFRPW
jgi:sarcosine oxidase subunit alpha